MNLFPSLATRSSATISLSRRGRVFQLNRARTELDAEEARQKEITQARYASLDRIIQTANHGQSSSFTITTDITAPGLSDRERRLHQNLSARLAHLEKMGLAKSIAPQQWVVQGNFETVLRTLQRTVDRQKMLAAHGALLSDPRLPFEITNIQNLKAVEGRVLLHAEDEVSGRRYLLLEGTDAKVHLIYHTREIEEARRVGKLAVNSFVRLEKRFARGIPRIEKRNSPVCAASHWTRSVGWLARTVRRNTSHLP
jgi:hypothetical protein